MKTWMGLLVVALLLQGAVWAQEDVQIPVVDPPVENEVVIEEPTDPDDDLLIDENLPKATEAQRIQRLAEASGLPAEQILAMREGRVLEDPDNPTGETGVGHKVGWGKLVKDLGLHPGVLGHGTGDKFYPEVEVVTPPTEELPELPELDADTTESVEQSRERATRRNEVRRVERQESRDLRKAEQTNGAEVRRGNEQGKPDEIRGNANRKSEPGNRGNGNGQGKR